MAQQGWRDLEASATYAGHAIAKSAIHGRPSPTVQPARRQKLAQTQSNIAPLRTIGASISETGLVKVGNAL